MRKRLFDKKVKKLNLVTSTIDSPSVTATALSATTGIIVTLDGTTAGIDTVNVSSVLNVSGTAVIRTILRIPTSPHASSSELTPADYGTFYFSGLVLFVAKSGTWVSGTLGVG